MHSFLNFDKMITPTIIKAIFYVFSGLSILSGFSMIIGGTGNPYGGGIKVFMGLLVMLAGPFIARVYCELLIVLFKMHENLTYLKKSAENKKETGV